MSAAAAVRPPARLGARPVQAAIAVGGLLTVLLWWVETEQVAGWAGWLTNAGRLTGLACGYGAIVLVALVARLPAVERGVGTDRLVRWHAAGGRYVVCLALAHAGLILTGYALTARRSLPGEVADLLTQYPDVLLATAALALFLLVAVSSVRLARQRMAYETWHLVHLYSYLAIGLAFAHQFAAGSDFTDVQARIAWSALHLAVLALLVRYRVLAPVLAYYRHDLRIADVRGESHDTISVYLVGRNLDRLRAEAGQFFRWRFLTSNLWWVAAPYSLSAPAGPDTLRITVRVVGRHSQHIAELPVGTRVFVEGPYGGFTAARRRRERVLLIAGGVGITPIRTLFETLPGEVTLLYRASSPLDVVFRRELDEIAKARGGRVRYLIGPHGRHDPLTAPRLRGYLGESPDVDVYLCGPAGMVATVRAALRELRVPDRHIHQESFAF